MRLQPETITLGTESWLVRPLTVAQVQAIEPLLAAADAGPAGSIAAAVAILRIALARDHAAAAERIDDIEAAAPAIAAAMARVLRLGGFLPHGDAASGEVGADRGPQPPRSASTGPASTPA